MAKTPEAVRTFLEDLADKLQPLKAKDIETFLKFKKEEVLFAFEILNVIQKATRFAESYSLCASHHNGRRKLKKWRYYSSSIKEDL